MLLNIAYIIFLCTVVSLFFIVFSSKPYPSELEEQENQELKNKFDEYNKKSQE